MLRKKLEPSKSKSKDSCEVLAALSFVSVPGVKQTATRQEGPGKLLSIATYHLGSEVYLTRLSTFLVSFQVLSFVGFRHILAILVFRKREKHIHLRGRAREPTLSNEKE